MLIALIIKIIIAGLAVFALSETVTVEEGPFAIFRRIRYWLGKYPSVPYPEDRYNADAVSQWQQDQIRVSSLHAMWVDNDIEFLNSFRGCLYGIMSCAYCISVWISLLITAIFILAMPADTAWPLVVLEGISIFSCGIAGQRILKRKFGDD